MSDELLIETRGAIRWVTFNRPESRNALTFAMYDGLADVCRSIPDDWSVRAVVVTGAGGAFAAGTDMAQFRSFSTPQDGWDYEERMEKVFDAIERCPVPTIAAIDGACTGGGAAIAACCDIRLTTPRLKFGFPIARTLGNCLSASNLARLSRLMGDGRVKDVILTSRLLQADEAQASGLVSEVLDDNDALLARADELANRMAEQAPLTMQATKEAMRRNAQATGEVNDHDLVELCYMSDDFKEGMDAFLSKRKPVWKGR